MPDPASCPKQESASLFRSPARITIVAGFEAGYVGDELDRRLAKLV